MTPATLPATGDGPLTADHRPLTTDHAPLTTDLPNSSLITQHSSLPATDHGQLTTDTAHSSLITQHSSLPPASFWLFSNSVDLSVFLGSALTALAALWIGS